MNFLFPEYYESSIGSSDECIVRSHDAVGNKIINLTVQACSLNSYMITCLCSHERLSVCFACGFHKCWVWDSMYLESRRDPGTEILNSHVLRTGFFSTMPSGRKMLSIRFSWMLSGEGKNKEKWFLRLLILFKLEVLSLQIKLNYRIRTQKNIWFGQTQ